MAKKASSKKTTTAKKAKSAGRKMAAAGGKSSRAKTKSPLTKAQIKALREKLLEKRRALLGDMAGIENEALGDSRQNVPADPTDLGSDSYEQEFSLGLLESERQLLREINEALDRINRGVYGICLGTGKPIGLPRLQARPWAKYCIEYARMIEKGLVRPGDEERQRDDRDEDEYDEEGDDEAEDDESWSEDDADDVPDDEDD